MRPLRTGDPSSIGPYQLTGFLGEGGQGSVYLATSPTSGEPVAVKLLHARFTEDERAVRRFLREADSVRRVAEFCTARVLDVAEVDGQPYIVGEYVDGPSLQRQVSKEGPLRGQALIRLAVATATALTAIHRAGVVHRDFKPGNVLLGPDGPRVIDFGIARALDVSQSMTTSVVGTPAFMAPEQFLGDAQPASDVFAWAGTMVFAATGRGAFGFGALPVVMHRILNGEPDLSGVPEALVPLLWASLAKDHHRRPTADQLMRELIRSSGASPDVHGTGGSPDVPGSGGVPGAHGSDGLPGSHAPAPPGGAAGGGFATPGGTRRLADPTAFTAVPLPGQDLPGQNIPGQDSPSRDLPHQGLPGQGLPGQGSPAGGGAPDRGGEAPGQGDASFSGPERGWAGPGSGGGPGQGSAVPGSGGGPGQGWVDAGFGGGAGREWTGPTAPGRQGLLITAGAAATAVVVGLVAWMVVQFNDRTAATPTTTPGPIAYGSALTSVVRPSGKKGGTVRLASAAGLDSTDPADMYTTQAWNMVRLYGRALTMFKPAPDAAGTRIVPDLAESLGKPSDGGKTWTYTLRRGLKFADGTPITSADVAYAVLRSMDSGFEQGTSYFDLMLDLPAGYEGPYKSPAAVTTSAIETPDDRTIVFHLKEPFATFDHVVQLPETIPVPKAKDTRGGYALDVVASGPYRFARVAENSVVLERNPHWSADSDPNRTALPDRFELTYGMDAVQAAGRLKAGEAEVGPVLPDGEIAAVLGDPARKAEADAPITTVRVLAINPQVPPFDRPDCRRAVVRALDLKAVRAADLPLTDEVPTSLVPPTVPGQHPAVPGLTPDGDPAAARQDLAKCGRPGGFPAKYVYRDLPQEAAVAQAVRTALGEVGIDVSLEAAPVAEFHQSKGGSPEYLRKNQVGLIAKSWIYDWPDPYSFLPEMVDSRRIREKDYSFNVSVRLPTVDAVLDRATSRLDPRIRAALWAEAERRVAGEAVLVPLTWRRSLLLRGAGASNLHVSPIYADYDLTTIGVTTGS
ncbi:ABC transporter substrate-binding protein [Nonomuraea fuscirosea]|uniref:ABC transporter substrate-binding protein n=1 Tax=Nonomuraea fuscirosea TaxID=1291556 RepID=UPI0033D649E7